jgi:hypothetical protein
LNPFEVKPGEVERGFAPHFDIEPIAAQTGPAAHLMRRRSAQRMYSVVRAVELAALRPAEVSRLERTHEARAILQPKGWPSKSNYSVLDS